MARMLVLYLRVREAREFMVVIWWRKETLPMWPIREVHINIPASFNRGMLKRPMMTGLHGRKGHGAMHTEHAMVL
jgi:hypothetical protein